MKKLLDVEQSGGMVHKTYLHTGDDNKDCISVVTSQDVEPVFNRAKELSQNQGKEFRFKAAIAGNVINDACYRAAKLWGVSAKEALSEIMSSKTDRSKALLKILSEGRDFRKFQAKHYA
jgi:hypothetical protein